MNARTDACTCLPRTQLDPCAVLQFPLQGRDEARCVDLVGLAQVSYYVNASVPSVTIELKVAGTVVWRGEVVSASAAPPAQPRRV